jgi:hypothetical protein
MKQKILNYGILVAALLCALCSRVTFDNPIDPQNPNHVADSLMADKNGNGIADYFEIITPVNTDKEKPVITFIGPDTVILKLNDPNFSKIGVTAHDNIDGDLTSSVTWSPEVYTSKCETFVVTYSVSDKAGNTAHRTRVIIIDCEGPVITLKGKTPDTIALNGKYTDPGATAFDNIDSVVSVTPPAAPNTSQVGVDSMVYTSVDKVGNQSRAVRVLVVYKPAVIDSIPPVITLKGSKDTTIQLGNTFVDPGYTAWDNIDSNITNNVVKSGSVNTAQVGIYTITYTVSDKAGNNAAPQIRTVTVKKAGGGADVTPPLIVLKPRIAGRDPSATDTVRVGSGPYIDPGYTATDDFDGKLTDSVVITELYGKALPINTGAPGAYTLKYSVSDKAGNRASVTRDVLVVGVSNDKTPPLIALTPPLKDSVGVGRRYRDPGYSATDDVDLNITNKVQRAFKNSLGAAVDSNSFFTAMGQYSITYTVSDMAGNPATPQSRTVVVFDTTRDTSSLLAKYGLPLPGPLPSISNTTYTIISAEGTGAPAVATIKDFILSWRNVLPPTLDNFALDLTINPYYLDLKPKITQTFSQAQPQFTLKGTGVDKLDGSYYITASATQCVWVSTKGTFAIVFKK